MLQDPKIKGIDMATAELKEDTAPTQSSHPGLPGQRGDSA